MSEYKTIYRRLKKYWNDYGGYRAFLRSPIVHTSIFISILNFENYVQEAWIGKTLSTIPNLLGFGIGVYALVFTLISIRLKDALKKVKNDNGKYYIDEINANFFHISFIQIISLAISIIFGGFVKENGDFIFNIDIKIAYFAHILSGFFGYFLLSYSILLSLSAIMLIYRLTSIQDQKSSQDSVEG